MTPALTRFWKEHKGIIVVALIIGAAYGGYMLDRYIKITQDSARRAAVVVRPRQRDGDIAEIGYIYSMRDDIFLDEENRVNLVWFVKVPATGARYSCAYQEGFSEFHKGNDVRIIRANNLETVDGYGYIVGLHEKLKGKAAWVWVIDEEELEMDRVIDEDVPPE